MSIAMVIRGVVGLGSQVMSYVLLGGVGDALISVEIASGCVDERMSLTTV